MQDDRMLDTRSDAADELIADGYVSDELLANRLALLANELTHERNEAEAQRDKAIKQRDAALARAAAAELALMNMTARVADRDARQPANTTQVAL